MNILPSLEEVKQIAASGLFGCRRRRKPCGAAADNHQVMSFTHHYLSSPSRTLPVKRLEPASLKR